MQNTRASEQEKNKNKDKKTHLAVLLSPALVNIEQRLELDDQLPLVVRHVLPVELLEGVDALSRYQAVERILLFELATVHGLVTAHLDLDGNRRLALLADRNLFVVSLNTRAVFVVAYISSYSFI